MFGAVCYHSSLSVELSSKLELQEEMPKNYDYTQKLKK